MATNNTRTMRIDLMSDTVTRPTPAMREAMFQAAVGDDVFEADPTVNALQEKAAAMLGHEAALFCPSGTMTNQIAIKLHTQPLDEVICEEKSHIYQYETGGYAFNSGVAIKLIHGHHGMLTPEQVRAAVNPTYDWLPTSTLLVVEQPTNKGGGSYYDLDTLKALRTTADELGLKYHMDGARLFNALVETGDDPAEVGALFDSVSICLSKGLGAPVGSLLLGSKDFVKRGRRFRKVMGGGMRQAGFLAAAGIYALDHHIDRLKTDNDRAKRMEQLLPGLSYVDRVHPVRTNIVLFDLVEPHQATDLLEHLAAADIHAVAFGPKTVRLTFHLDISDEMEARLVDYLCRYGG